MARACRGGCVVTVERGDSLWEIAEDEYGDGTAWPRIYKANDDQIDDARRIYYRLTDLGRRVLVDSGLFQGLKELRERNWQDPQFDPASIDAVLITHAHIDHVDGVGRAKEATGAPILLHPDDAPLYEAAPTQAQWFGMQLDPLPPVDEYALASRLSYVLWSSMPDEELTRREEGSACAGPLP